MDLHAGAGEAPFLYADSQGALDRNLGFSYPRCGTNDGVLGNFHGIFCDLLVFLLLDASPSTSLWTQAASVATHGSFKTYLHHVPQWQFWSWLYWCSSIKIIQNHCFFGCVCCPFLGMAPVLVCIRVLTVEMTNTIFSLHFMCGAFFGHSNIDCKNMQKPRGLQQRLLQSHHDLRAAAEDAPAQPALQRASRERESIAFAAWPWCKQRRLKEKPGEIALVKWPFPWSSSPQAITMNGIKWESSLKFVCLDMESC